MHARGRPLTYVHKRRLIHCTCWGHAEFALDGRVLYWPRPNDAGKPIPVYPVEVAGNMLTIRVEGLA